MLKSNTCALPYQIHNDREIGEGCCEEEERRRRRRKRKQRRK